jgi:hypothetical protein
MRAMRNRREAALKAWKTIRSKRACIKVRAAEAASKAALKVYCEETGWHVAFFEGKTGAPRTGIIDAVAFRLRQKNADALEVRLIQLKGGNAGVSGREIARLKKAVDEASISWMIAAFDGQDLQTIPGVSASN